jgi:hypothetical protein
MILDSCYQDWVYYWLQNAIWFLWENIRNWCVICVCFQRESNSGSLRNLPFKVEPCTSPIFLVAAYVTCPGTSLHPTWPVGTSPAQCQESSFMDTITFLTVVSDSKISVTSATLTLIWPSDLPILTYHWWPHSLPPPPRTPCKREWRGTCMISAPMDNIVSYTVMNSYPCLPTHFLRHFSTICACWPALLLQQKRFDVTLSNAEGTSWRWSGFEGRSWSDLNL